MRLAIAFLIGCTCASVVTQWDAVEAIASVYCDDDPSPTCRSDVERGWCPDASACAAPVEDLDLLDRCLATVAPHHVEPECWALVR